MRLLVLLALCALPLLPSAHAECATVAAPGISDVSCDSSHRTDAGVGAGPVSAGASRQVSTTQSENSIGTETCESRDTNAHADAPLAHVKYEHQAGRCDHTFQGESYRYSTYNRTTLYAVLDYGSFGVGIEGTSWNSTYDDAGFARCDGWVYSSYVSSPLPFDDDTCNAWASAGGL